MTFCPHIAKNKNSTHPDSNMHYIDIIETNTQRIIKGILLGEMILCPNINNTKDKKEDSSNLHQWMPGILLRVLKHMGCLLLRSMNTRDSIIEPHIVNTSNTTHRKVCLWIYKRYTKNIMEKRNHRG